MHNIIDQHHDSTQRTSNNLLSLTVIPAFPLLISSEVAFIKDNTIIHQQVPSQSSSILLADELDRANQGKIFSTENVFSDRLSLISSTDSVNSATESELNHQFIDQDKICLQFSNWLIHSMEERHWQEYTKYTDFYNPLSQSVYLQNSTSVPDFNKFSVSENNQHEKQFCKSWHLSETEYRKEAGNSIFYAISNDHEFSEVPKKSSRVYSLMENDVDGSQQNCPCSSKSSSSKNTLQKQPRRRRSLSEGNSGAVDISRYSLEATKPMLSKCSSILEGSKSTQSLLPDAIGKEGIGIKELFLTLADIRAFQNSVNYAKLMRAFDSSNDIKISLRNWRTPRKKFIFELHKQNDFLTQLVLQRHRCAGCGLKLDRFYAKRARFCHYYSKLFCQCCHQGAKARIPAQIIHNWNFKEYPVCDAALNFLSENEDQPVFNVKLINPNLYICTKNLRRFRKLRLRIAHMWPFVQTCRLAEELMTEHGILRTMFTSMPKRFLTLESVDVYSIVDFERIANKNLLELLEPLVVMGTAHIEVCMNCRQRAFFCQFCMDPMDLLFPFQLERCHRCDGCGSLSHLKCYKIAAESTLKTNSTCVGHQEFVTCNKCERIRKKK